MLKHFGKNLMNILGISSDKTNKKKYFRISSNLDLRLIGCYPRIYTFLGEDKRDFFTTGESHQYQSITAKNFSYIELYKRTKLTDIFWTDVGSMQGVFFNKKVLDVLKNFNIGKYECTDVRFLKKNKKGDKIIDDYQWIIFNSDDHQLIDFEESEFIIKEISTDKFIRKIKVSSFDNLIEYYNKLIGLECIQIKKVRLTDYANRLDLISYVELHTYLDLIISEELLIALQKEGITGFEVRPIRDWTFI